MVNMSKASTINETEHWHSLGKVSLVACWTVLEEAQQQGEHTIIFWSWETRGLYGRDNEDIIG